MFIEIRQHPTLGPVWSNLPREEQAELILECGTHAAGMVTLVRHGGWKLDE